MTLSTIIAQSHDSINALQKRIKTAPPYKRERMQARIDVHILYLTKLQLLQEAMR